MVEISNLLTNEWYPLTHHPAQSGLWRCRDRFQAVRAGRGSGKTTILLRKLVRHLPMEISHTKPPMYCYIGPTREQAKRVAWGILKRLINPMWLASAPSETELKFTTIWGSELYVLGFDKPERIEGVQWDGAVVDESSDIKANAVNLSLLPALSDRRGWLVRTGIPKRSGPGAAEYKAICEDRKYGYTFHYWSAEDLLDEERIQSLKQALSEKDYDEQIKGLAVDQGGRAFSAFTEAGNVSQAAKYDKNRPIIVGSDFNVTPMAWCCCHIIDGELQVFDEIWLRDTNTKAALDELYRRYGDHKAGFIFTGDATGKARKTAASSAAPSDYALIKQDRRFSADPHKGTKGSKVTYPKLNPAIKDRLASCNALLCNASDEHRVKINPNCLHLIQDLQVRDVDQNGQPVDAEADIGHISDAFGYVVHRFFPVHLDAANVDGTSNQKNNIALTVVG